MKNIILTAFLMFNIGVCYSAPNACETGYACSLDKLRLMEEQKQQKEIKETKFLKKEKNEKEYKDFFIFIKPKT